MYVNEGKLIEDKRVEEMRVAARARREAKEQEKQSALQDQGQDQDQEEESGASSKENSSRGSTGVEELVEGKLSRGLKLTHKGCAPNSSTLCTSFLLVISFVFNMICVWSIYIVLMCIEKKALKQQNRIENDEKVR
jgi:hypothetical protein